MSTIKKQIQEARPKLRAVSPQAHWTVMVMGIFNILLSTSFLLLLDTDRFTAPLLIVNELLTFKFWGVVFGLLGVFKLYSLWANDWNLARRSLILGVSIKAAWAVALTIRTIISPGTAFLNLTWIALAVLQMGAYIHFMPPAMASYKQRKKERDNE